jgi:hypothetical protein
MSVGTNKVKSKKLGMRSEELGIKSKEQVASSG